MSEKLYYPPYALAIATLLFWGWQVESLWLAIPMSFALGLNHFFTWRWELTDKEFNRICDVTWFALVGAALYFFNQESLQGLFTLLKWSPIIFFPLIFCQYFSLVGNIQLSSLFLSLRHLEKVKPSESFNLAQWIKQKANYRINLAYPYLILCLLSASEAYHKKGFFECSFILVCWGLWNIRPQRYPRRYWAFLLFCAYLVANAGHYSLHLLQLEMESFIVDWFQELWLPRDPYRQNTAIGEIGKLKASEQIILRVKTNTPLLLREATYTHYFKGTWQARNGINFDSILPTAENLTTWNLIENTQLNPLLTQFSPQTIEIFATTAQGKAVLSLPLGSFKIRDLNVFELERNTLGTFKTLQAPKLVHYKVDYFDKATPLDPTPYADEDLDIPPNEVLFFKQLAQELGLLDPQLSKKQILQKIEAFFAKDFRYSLLLSAPTEATLSPLENFVRYKKAGHCEYFATTTVLLLRAAGIPARYAAGFAVEEFSRLEDAYIVRKRHAHAWSLAYIDNAWQEIDTTPWQWMEQEKEQSSGWQPLFDSFSFIYYRFQRWQLGQHNTQWLWISLWILVIVLIWRLALKKRIQQIWQQINQPAASYARQGQDSAFYQIIEFLEKQGFHRQTGETLGYWLQRIHSDKLDTHGLQELLIWHQRYRFDPRGLELSEFNHLQTQSYLFLQKLKAQLKINS